MKKLSTLFLGLTLALTSQAQTLLSTTLNTSEEFNAWTVVDVNNDGKTWTFNSENPKGRRTYYNYSSSKTANDWFISPALTAETAGNYLVSYTYEGGETYPEAMNVAYASSADVDALAANVVKEHPVIHGVCSDFFFIQMKAGETVYVGFQAVSTPDQYRLYLSSVEVKMSENPVDLTVTDLIAPVSSENLTASEQATLKIANEGLADALAGSYTVTVNVDGEDAFTETINQDIPAGSNIVVTLGTPLDLSSKHHNYKLNLTVTHPDDASAANNTLSATVRHIGPASEPYTMGFESDEDTTDIKFFDLNQDSGHWSIQSASYFFSPANNGYYALCYNYDRENAADDWAILDGIQMEAGYHVLRFWVTTMDASHTEAFSVAWGTEATPEAMVNTIEVFDPITTAPYVQKICIFELKEPATVYIGFHATSPADQNWIGIDDIEVDAIGAGEVEIEVKDLANPTAYLPAWESKSVKFNVMNHGIEDADATISIKIDDEEVYNQTVSLVAQQDKTFTIADLTGNLSEGIHTVSVNVFNADEIKTDNNTVSAEFRVLGETSIFWDFEDATVPTNFTIRRNESSSLSQDAVSEFGQDGLGMLNIDEHELYGSYMLAISTWINDYTEPCDTYLVLPQVHVDSEDACIVFNAGQPSDYGNESYLVEVSDGEDVDSAYQTILTVDAENYVRNTRGADLGEFAGKDVYVAFNVTTVNGDCLALDNIGLYGCTLIDSSVKSISNSAASLKLMGNNLVSSAEGIYVYDSLGRTVANVNSNSLSVASLAPGVYVARSGNLTLKFVK